MGVYNLLDFRFSFGFLILFIFWIFFFSSFFFNFGVDFKVLYKNKKTISRAYISKNMEIDGTYLMHNNERLSFSEGYQVGVTHIINRPTFFLFDDVQTHVLKYLIGMDEQLESIGHIFDAAEFDIRNSCQSGHSIRSDLVMDDEQFNTLKSFSMNANSLTNFIPRSFHEGHPMNLFGGIWEDKKEQVHVDVSSWVQDLDAALDLGKKYNQISIFDWSIMKCRCTKTGEILEY